MSEELEALTQAVLALAAEDRASLVDAVLRSHDDPGPLSPEWREELERRDGEFAEGKVELIDNDDVFTPRDESAGKG